MARVCASAHAQIPLSGRRLATRTATAWTIGARIFVELEKPTETSAALSVYRVKFLPVSQLLQALSLTPRCVMRGLNHGEHAHSSGLGEPPTGRPPNGASPSHDYDQGYL